MIIENTDVEAACDWPEDMKVQGGDTGMVMRSAERGGPYRTAFVEAFPAGTFIRGEGPTVAEAEVACWRKYQRVLHCFDGAEHGPFEARHYTNGSGFCVTCGAWFSGVCEPSLEHRIDSVVGQRLRARHGHGWHLLRQGLWDALRDHEEAVVRHLIGIGPKPGPAPTLTDADQQRLDEANRWYENPEPVDPEALATLRTLGSVLLDEMTRDLPEGP